MGLLALLVLGAANASQPATEAHDNSVPPPDRFIHDPIAQRAHGWQLWQSLVAGSDRRVHTGFSRWYDAYTTFASAEAATASEPIPPATTRPGSHGGPLITFIHYNPAAYRHIRRHHLHQRATLDSLLHQATVDTPEIAALPTTAAVIMTAWWPVSGDAATPMPVWDGNQTTRPVGSNGYLNWSRVIAIGTAETLAAGEPDYTAFAGRVIRQPETVALERIYHWRLDARQATQLMSVPRYRQAVLLALGRPLHSGDYLALVAVHLMTAEFRDGVWATFWWQPEIPAEHALQRPASLPAPWDHYAMDITVDAVFPRQSDGSPNICFNPWFDAVFPDSGAGNGLRANCISCHLRAGYPPRGALSVTRGNPEDRKASSARRLHTGLLWSIANTAPRQPTPALP